MQSLPLAADGPSRPVGMYPMNRHRIPRRPHNVPKIAYWLFLVLVVLSTFNVGSIYTWLYGSAVPINPIAFGVLAVPIFILGTRPPRRLSYFRAAWFFWIVYAVGGFFGEEQITGVYLYGTLQNVFKIWISLIGIPWLAARTVNEKHLPSYLQVICVVIAAGAGLSIYQLFNPSAFVDATTGGGRGAGVWINPNLCGAMCTTGILFTLMTPFRFAIVKNVLLVVLFGGVFSTLSRGGILTALLALMVYAVMTFHWMTIFRILIITLVLGVGGILALEPLKNTEIPGLAQRIEGIQRMLQGEVGAQTVKGRWTIWEAGFRAAAEHWFVGRGHGSMNYVVKLGYLEYEGRYHAAGPHNYYIYVWGNSGLLALLALLVLWASMIRLGLQCKDERVRAGLVSVVAAFMLMAMTNHALFSNQFVGSVFAAFAVAAHYGRERSPVRKVLTRPVASRLATA